jgi:hypothetical protein
MYYRSRLQERQRPQMAKAAAMLGGMFVMLKGERGRLRANYSAEE